MNSVSCIYIIINAKSNKVYIGQAQDVSKRWQHHRATLRGGYHRNRYLQRAWDKYGEKAFSFKILEYCSIEQLDEREQHYLDIYISKNICYNIAIDAKSSARGVKRSDETRMRISAAQKGQKRQPPSDETKRKISESNKGKPKSEAHRKNLSIASMGKIVSQETRKKIGDAGRGRTISEESRERMRTAAQLRVATQRMKKQDED